MELIPEWIPNIYPKLVRVPIAFNVLVAAINLASLFVSERW